MADKSLEKRNQPPDTSPGWLHKAYSDMVEFVERRTLILVRLSYFSSSWLINSSSVTIQPLILLYG